MSTGARVCALWCALLLAAAPAHAEPGTSGYSAANLYNEGNAYARSGKPGLAVLSYERATLLAPNDPDIAANLRSVRAQAETAAKDPGAIEHLLDTANPNAVAWTGLAGLIIAGGGALLARRSAKRRGALYLVACVGVLLMALPGTQALLWWPRLHSAVVLAREAALRAAPVPMGDTLLTLRESAMVRVIGEHDEFLLVRSADGRLGWMARADLGFIVPPSGT